MPVGREPSPMPPVSSRFAASARKRNFRWRGSKDDHASINWSVSVKKDGIRWQEVRDDDAKQQGRRRS